MVTKKTIKKIAKAFVTPKYLSETAKEKWKELLPLLDDKKVI